MDRAFAKQLRKEIMEAAQKIAEKHGYEVKSGSGKFDSVGDEYTLNSITFYQKGEASKNYSNAEERELKLWFDAYKSAHSLQHVNVGDGYFDPNKGCRMTLLGWKKRNRKYPILVADEKGNTYKMTPQCLKLNLEYV